MSILKKSMFLGAGLLLAVAGANSAMADSWSYKGWKQWHPHQGGTILSSMGTQNYFPKKDNDDHDGDGVKDEYDQCPNTPKGTEVDYRGCDINTDTDGDGVIDLYDRCPDTPPGTTVNPNDGCRAKIDSDGDGVYDEDDICPNTPAGATVNQVGCWVVENIQFDFNEATIKSEARTSLNQVADILHKSSGLHVEVQGHTDILGDEEYNLHLSQRRADSVRNYLIGQGVSSDRLSARGYGFHRPVASNSTKEGRAINRRVELEPMQH
ncbi:MAG: OmpA family protein [Magnetococcales bacterium]|nr:OmpA family protein [Magnetococcales bacterium]